MLYDVLAEPGSYSIVRSSGVLTEAVFTNAGAGARAPCNIVDSVYPQLVPSVPLIIPTTSLASQVSYDGSTYQNYPDWAGQYGGSPGWVNYFYQNTEFYSSNIVPRNAITTIQMDLVGYTGTIKAQWANDYQGIWYNASESTTYYDETKTIYMNVVGWYPLLRICFNNSIWSTPTPPGVAANAFAVCTEGVLSSLILQNGGSGYLAPPKVNILGDGAGAVVEAIMSDVYPPGHPQAGLGFGSVTGFNIISGGSGYWPVPSGGVNSASYPVPPANQGALVVISTGYVVNLYYR